MENAVYMEGYWNKTQRSGKKEVTRSIVWISSPRGIGEGMQPQTRPRTEIKKANKVAKEVGNYTRRESQQILKTLVLTKITPLTPTPPRWGYWRWWGPGILAWESCPTPSHQCQDIGMRWTRKQKQTLIKRHVWWPRARISPCRRVRHTWTLLLFINHLASGTELQ